MVLYLSTYILVMTAIDRHRAIVQPLSTYTWTPRRAHGMIAIAWVLALIFSIPQLFIFGMREVEPDSGVYDCWANFSPPWTVQLYITGFALTIYVIPFFILLILYGNICVRVWGNVRRTHRGATGCSVTTQNTGSNGIHQSGNHHTNDSASPNGCSSNYGPIHYRFTGTGVISVIHADRKKCNGRYSLSSSSAEEVCLNMRHLGPPNSSQHISRSASGSSSQGLSAPGNMTSSTGVQIISNNRTSASRMSQSKIKTIKLTFVVIIAYFVCWAPFFVTQLWWAYDKDAPYNSEYDNIHKIHNLHNILTHMQTWFLYIS